MSTRSALITGGTSGIGLETAQVLVAQGYRVAVTGVNDENVARAREVLGDAALVLPANALNLDEVRRAIQTAAAELGGFDLLYLNAGISIVKPLADASEGDYDAMFDINTKATYFALQAGCPAVKDGGSVVFTVGIGATHGMPGHTLSGASKAALLGLIPSLLLELAPRRIRVNAVSPGVIATPLLARVGLTPEVLKAVGDQIPAGRVGAPRDIAHTVAFLASDAAAYVNGQNLVVAGGAGARV